MLIRCYFDIRLYSPAFFFLEMGICRLQCPEIIFKKADISVHALRVLARACPPAVPAHSALISSLPVGLPEQPLHRGARRHWGVGGCGGKAASADWGMEN